MTTIERMRAALTGAPHDYPPVIWIATSVVCETYSIPQNRWSQDPELLADSLVRFSRDTECDGIYVTRDNLVTHEALGGAIEWPDDDEPLLLEPVLSDLDALARLQIPQPESAAGMRTVLEAARIAVDRAGSDFYVMANIDCGPFSTAANLLGVEGFLARLYGSEKRQLHELLDFACECVIAYGRAMQRSGVHGIQMGEATAGLIGRDQFAEFALPYIHRAAEALNSSDCDLWLHICGRTDHLIADLRDLPIDVFELDSLVPLDRARQLIGDRIALKGNLDTLFLQNENSRRIDEQTRTLIGSCRMPEKLIVSAGCGVPRHTPVENLRAVSRACRETPLP